MPIRDPAHRQIVRTDLDLHSVARHDSDIVHAHLAAHVSQHLEVPLIELHAKTSVRKILEDCAIELDSFLLAGLIAYFLLEVPSSRHEPTSLPRFEKRHN